MKREDKYIEQLTALGIWDEAFRPEVSELAQLEREKTRVKKAWSAAAKKDESSAFTGDLYAVLCGLRREILAHREALGLTPKSLRRLRGAAADTDPGGQSLLSKQLDLIAQRTAAYSGGIEAVPSPGTDGHG